MYTTNIHIMYKWCWLLLEELEEFYFTGATYFSVPSLSSKQPCWAFLLLHTQFLTRKPMNPCPYTSPEITLDVSTSCHSLFLWSQLTNSFISTHSLTSLPICDTFSQIPGIWMRDGFWNTYLPTSIPTETGNVLFSMFLCETVWYDTIPSTW